MHPAHAPAKIAFQSKSPGFSCAAASLHAVVEDHRSAQTIAPVAVHRRHIGARDAVVLEVLVERLHAHGADALGNQVADRIVGHGRDDSRLQTKAIGKVGGHIELAATDVNLALRGLAEGDDPRIEPVHQRAQRQKIQLRIFDGYSIHDSSAVYSCFPKEMMKIRNFRPAFIRFPLYPASRTACGPGIEV